MTASTSSSPSPGTPGSPQPRHRASGGRGYGRETETSGPIPAAPREGGRHRAPDAPPSSGFRIVPGPREAEETGRSDGPGAGFRPLPPSGPTPPPASGLSSIGVPLGAVPTQREPAPRPRRRPAPDTAAPIAAAPIAAAPTAAGPEAAVPRRRPAATGPDVGRDDEAVTVPIPRETLDRAAARRPGDPTGHPSSETLDPPLRPLTVQRPAGPPRPTPRPRGQAADDVPHRPTVAGPAVPRRGVAPWETPPVDRDSARLGLVAIVVGLVGALVALAPWSGLLPRVLPATTLGITPVFNLVGALLGVLALGLGAVAMFRAVATSRGLLAGVVGACAGAAAIVVGLVV